MMVSLNELDSMVRKAFRGAGYHWGEAEEAGKAAVWLGRRNLPVLGPLLSLLGHAQDNLPTMRPLGEGSLIRSSGPLLCPVLAGISLFDRAAELSPETRLEYHNLACPLLCAPFLAMAAQASALRLELASPSGVSLAVGPALSIDAASLQSAADLIILRASLTDPSSAELTVEDRGPVSVDPGEWSRISHFAHYTYVPSSQGSRLFGAGAGVEDND